MKYFSKSLYNISKRFLVTNTVYDNWNGLPSRHSNMSNSVNIQSPTSTPITISESTASSLSSPSTTSESPKLRILLFGSTEFSLSIFERQYKTCIDTPKIIQSIDIVVPPRKKRRIKNKYDIVPSPQEKIARNFSKVNIYNVPDDSDFYMSTFTLPKTKYWDIGIVASFGYMIPDKIISLFPMSMINVHGSLLPKYRGASPIQYSISNGDTYTGITILTLNPNTIDTGNILLRRSIAIEPNETFITLRDKLAILGSNLLIDVLSNWDLYIQASLTYNELYRLEGMYKMFYYNYLLLLFLLLLAGSKLTKKDRYCKKIQPSDCIINFTKKNALDIDRHIRSLLGFKTVYTLLGDYKIIPLSYTIQDSIDLTYMWDCNNKRIITVPYPGTILYDSHKKNIVIVCADRKSFFILHKLRVLPFSKVWEAHHQFFNLVEKFKLYSFT